MRKIGKGDLTYSTLKKFFNFSNRYSNKKQFSKYYYPFQLDLIHMKFEGQIQLF